MGHGFDDQGREFDETGKIRNWWTPETNKKFLAQTERFAAEYNAFCRLVCFLVGVATLWLAIASTLDTFANFLLTFCSILASLLSSLTGCRQRLIHVIRLFVQA
jgi:hypothetical protein